jgi:hypothetical protein
MPIRKQDYPPNWDAISLQVRADANNRCEWCGVANATCIVRIPAQQHCRVTIGEVTKEVPFFDFEEHPPKTPGTTRIILTVAHLDRDTHNNERSNLAALCQRCHLNHDRKAQHIPNRRYGRDHKKEHQFKLL